MFPAGLKSVARNLPGICLPLYASCGGLKNGRNAISVSSFFYQRYLRFKKFQLRSLLFRA
ncbi:hypothetical protein ISS30_07220 [bacterium]|nr:hypothetical protein [bacterium]